MFFYIIETALSFFTILIFAIIVTCLLLIYREVDKIDNRYESHDAYQGLKHLEKIYLHENSNYLRKSVFRMDIVRLIPQGHRFANSSDVEDIRKTLSLLKIKGYDWEKILSKLTGINNTHPHYGHIH